MKTLNIKQGSDEWIAERRNYRAASEAPVVMGCGYISRDALLRMKSTGGEQEFSRYVREVVLERGHEIEAAARPAAEDQLGEELYPVTGVCDDGYLLASFDGLTMGEDVVWECKSWNAGKLAEMEAGRVPEKDYWQVVQQLAVSGADRAMYMLADGEGETRSLFLDRADVLDDIERLRRSWAQFDADLAEYVPGEVVAEPVGRAPSDLPALNIQVTGAVTASNLEGFRDHALAVFAGINESLDTDEDFANAEKTVSWCGEVEKKLKAAKDQALGQTADIDALFRAIDEISEEARQKRLRLDKLVKARKQSIRAEILAEAREGLSSYLESLSVELPAGHSMPPMNPDFAGAMKGKRTVSSLRAATEQLLADSKVEAGQVFERVSGNLAAFADGGEFAAEVGLFPDLDALALKPAEDFTAVVKLRIAEHAERQRKEKEAADAARADAVLAEAAADKAAHEERVRLEAEGRARPDPEPAPAAPAPAKRDEGGRGASRPDLNELSGVVADAYGVHAGVAKAWLLDAVAAHRSAAA